MSKSLSSLYSKIATAKTRATLTTLLIFLLPFERVPSLDVFSVTIRMSQIVGLALILVSVGPIVTFYKSRPYLPKFLLPAFLFSYLLSALMSTDLKRAAMVFVFTVFVALVGSAIAATLTVDELPHLEKYLYISTAVVLAVGFYQYLGDVFGLSPALTGLRDIYTKEVFGFPRVQSTALEPLYYGSFLLIPYCLLLAKRLQMKFRGPILESILLFCIVTQIALSVSRGAIIGSVVSLVTIIILLWLRKKLIGKKLAGTVLLIIIGFAVAYAMTLISPKSNGAKYKSEAKAKNFVVQATNLTAQDDRIRNRTLAIEAFRKAPILGVGPGNFSQFAVQVYPSYATATPVIVNNEPLELLAESGIAGLILFAAYIAWTYITVAIRYYREKLSNTPLAYWIPAILAYLVALAIQYQTFSTLYIMHVWFALGLLMSFLTLGATSTKK